MTSKSYGFNIPYASAILLTDYDVQVDGESILNSTRENAKWSEESLITTFFEIELELSEVLSQCSLPTLEDPSPGVLGAIVGWKSSRTGIHGASEPQVLVDGVNKLYLEVDGSLLGGDLRLQVSVILLENPVPHSNPLAPTHYGSWLWGQSLNVQLDGDGSMFPVSAFDFKELGLDPKTAMWRIAISEELNSHVSSAVRLKLNTGHSRIKHYLQDPTTPENLELGRFLRAETITQMLIVALNSDVEQLLLDSANEGTLAEALLQMHKSYFPEKSIFSTQEEFRSDPGLVFATVQAVEFFDRKKK